MERAKLGLKEILNKRDCYIDWHVEFYKACEQKNKCLAMLIIDRVSNMNLFYIDSFLEEVCYIHYDELIDYLIDHGADINYGLYGACKGGHVDLVRLMLQKGAGAKYCFDTACFITNINTIEIIQILIEHGANDWNTGIVQAFQANNRELVLFMLEKGSDQIDYGLFQACKDGDIDLALLMLEKGADNFTEALEIISDRLWRYIHSTDVSVWHDLATLMLEKGAEYNNSVLNPSGTFEYFLDRDIELIYKRNLSGTDIVENNFSNQYIKTKYKKQFRQYKHRMIIAKNILNNYLIDDLTSIILAY